MTANSVTISQRHARAILIALALEVGYALLETVMVAKQIALSRSVAMVFSILLVSSVMV